jgi:hypothetical protein
MRFVIDLTAFGTLALITVTVTPTTANARSQHTEIGANPRAATGMGPESDYPLVVGEAFNRARAVMWSPVRTAHCHCPAMPK